MKSVAAVIVTYNNAATIVDCLTSVKAAGIDTVIVVDNNSDDDTSSLAKNSAVVILNQKSNIGFAAAANEGARHIPPHIEYILCLNPDTILARNAIKQAVALMESDSKVGIVGCLLRDKKTNQVEKWGFGSFPTLFTLITNKVIAPTPISELTEVDWVSGGCMLIRRTVWQHLGGFDPQFFLYWEDVDICRRAKSKGYKVVVIPTAICQHVRGQSSSNQTEKTRLYDDSADRYFRKHYPLPIWGTQRILRRLYRLLFPLAP